MPEMGVGMERDRATAHAMEAIVPVMAAFVTVRGRMVAAAKIRGRRQGLAKNQGAALTEWPLFLFFGEIFLVFRQTSYK